MANKLPLPRWRVKSTRGGWVIEVNQTGKRYEWLDGRIWRNQDEALDAMAKLTGPPKYLHNLRYAHLDPDDVTEEVRVSDHRDPSRLCWLGQHPNEDIWLVDFYIDRRHHMTCEAKDFEMAKRIALDAGFGVVDYIGRRGG